MGKLNYKSILVGVIVYAALWNITYKFLLELFQNSSDTGTESFFFDFMWKLIICFSYAIPGIVAGYISINRGMSHGFIVGLIGALLMNVIPQFIYSSAISSSSQIIGDVTLGIVLCLLGGAAGQIFAENNKSWI